jgi:Fe-S cluster assembly iron-binding protein IscA
MDEKEATVAEVMIGEETAWRLQRILESRGDPGVGLRVQVDHRCRCGGVRYGLGLAREHDGDRPAMVSGVQVFVASEVDREPGTATVDFILTSLSSGFAVTNSEHSCGSAVAR